jgi:hypothetical protein
MFKFEDRLLRRHAKENDERRGALEARLGRVALRCVPWIRSVDPMTKRLAHYHYQPAWLRHQHL